METIFIGVAGGSGSGKTTFTNHLRRRLAGHISVLYHDNYYRHFSDIPFEERKKLNYDHPDIFETDLLVQHLRALREGRAVQCPVYDFEIYNRSAQTTEIQPSSVVIVEGILIFQNSELADLFDIKIFVDTDADVRIIRRILRDVRERGRSLESVTEQYLQTVKPMHEQFVEPSKRAAHIIVPEGGHNLVALEMVVDRIKRHLLREDGQ